MAILIAATLVLVAAVAEAGNRWSSEGVPVCAAPGIQHRSSIAVDGIGGVILAWEDYRAGETDINIYAQRMDRDGTLRWGPDGILICGAPSNQFQPEVISDTRGEAIIIWSDNRNGNSDIYAQRVDMAGNSLWAQDVVPLCTESSDQYSQKAVGDGNGGAVVSWTDNRGFNGGTNQDIYSQSIDRNGSLRWTQSGVPICTLEGMEYPQEMASDGNGGAIITWTHERPEFDYTVRVQRVDKNGDTRWAENGLVICPASSDQFEPVVVTDDAGGAVVAWNDMRDGAPGIYMQRVDKDGGNTWDEAGVRVSDLGDNPSITGNGTGGAIASWDSNSSEIPVVCAQSVDSSGSPLWAARGVPLSNASESNEVGGIVTDGDGGAIITWHPPIVDVSYLLYPGILAQRVDSSGNALWTPGGDSVCVAAGGKKDPAMAPDGAGGAFISWTDDRSGNLDIYAQRVANTPPETSRIWAHDSIGVTEAAKTWYLAEGVTGRTERDVAFETWVLVQNPNDVPADVDLTYMTPDGPVPGPTTTLAPNSRITFNVAHTVPNEYEVSTKVMSDQPVVAERAVYANNRHRAHESIGATQPLTRWAFAEGTTGPSLDTYILVQNPNKKSTDVGLTFMTPDGVAMCYSETIGPESRATFRVKDYVDNWQVSTIVDSDVPVVAERSTIYAWDTMWQHGSIGIGTPAKTWYLAEGCTAGGFETWVLVLNPGDVEANVTLTYMTPSGAHPGPAATVPPYTRATFNVGDDLPGEWSVSTTVTSDKNVVVDRSLYGGARTWAHSSRGVSGLATEWYLAEGCTGTGFETWVLLQNPGEAPARAELTYMTPKGDVQGPVVTLEPHTRTTINIAETVLGECSVSTMVTSDHPITVERAMYGDPI